MFSVFLIGIATLSVMVVTFPFGHASILTEYPLPRKPYTAPYGLKVGSHGNIWFIESVGNAIGKLDPTTQSYTEYPIPTPNAMGYDLDVAPNGNIWFTESSSSKIGELNPTTGQILEFPTLTPHSYPFGIRVDASGNVWFTEYADPSQAGGNKIGEITTAGVMKEYPIPDANSGTHYLAPDANGRIWFAESSSSDEISVLDPQTGIVTQYMPPRQPILRWE